MVSIRSQKHRPLPQSLQPHRLPLLPSDPKVPVRIGQTRKNGDALPRKDLGRELARSRDDLDGLDGREAGVHDREKSVMQPGKARTRRR
jgi:hypothetical protein